MTLTKSTLACWQTEQYAVVAGYIHRSSNIIISVNVNFISFFFFMFMSQTRRQPIRAQQPETRRPKTISNMDI